MTKSMYDMTYGLFTYDVHSAIKVIPFLAFATDDADLALQVQQSDEYKHGRQTFIRRLDRQNRDANGVWIDAA